MHEGDNIRQGLSTSSISFKLGHAATPGCNDGDSDSGKTEVPAKEVAAPSNAALANGDEGESGIAEESADIEAGGSGENVA
ncbi:hypothetical protein FRB95_009460 [Tulasnella sp. JGI-2019a]|nr:hypothetical protein FRB95_009460 [Tulasnella sp. JGI-2019a]